MTYPYAKQLICQADKVNKVKILRGKIKWIALGKQRTEKEKKLNKIRKHEEEKNERQYEGNIQESITNLLACSIKSLSFLWINRWTCACTQNDQIFCG